MYWKISDFVEEIKKALKEEKLHINTIDGWFKKLEEEKLHYINRTQDTNEKVYDQLDLSLAIFIKKKRNEKWSLSAIFNELKSQFELRTFPMEYKESTNKSQLLDIDSLKARLIEDLRGTFEEIAATQLVEIKQHYEEILKQLPNPKTQEDEKEQRFQEMVIRRRVEFQLEEEAIHIWSTKPEEERFKKRGWFKREEDLLSRERFIKDYANKNFAERLKQELEL